MSPDRTWSVIIAGAGPAGIGTAVGLVRAGAVPPDRIVCLDKARFPRPKPCGGGLTGHAASAMAALGLRLRVPSVPCHRAQVVYRLHRRAVPMVKPVQVVRREEFDADLCAQAVALGIAVQEGQGLVAYQIDPQSQEVVVQTSGGHSLRGRVLVGADGAGSLVRRQLLAGYARAPAQPLRLARLEIEAPATLNSPEGAMVYDFSPLEEGLRGYVWLFPAPGGRLNVGAMHFPSSELGGRGLDQILSRTLRRYGVELPRPARGWPAWPYDPDAPIAGPHVLCVGDAAGIDALTGEGIAVGLEHGLVAARAIGSALQRGDFRFRHYREQIRHAVVGRELALDRRLASLLYASTNFRRWMGLVMFDPRMLELYAARVCGSEVLADRKAALLGAFARHLVLGGQRSRALCRAPR